jgi:hypothetical protein
VGRVGRWSGGRIDTLLALRLGGRDQGRDHSARGQRIRSSHGLCRGALGRAALRFGKEHVEGGAAANVERGPKREASSEFDGRNWRRPASGARLESARQSRAGHSANCFAAKSAAEPRTTLEQRGLRWGERHPVRNSNPARCALDCDAAGVAWTGSPRRRRRRSTGHWRGQGVRCFLVLNLSRPRRPE